MREEVVTDSADNVAPPLPFAFGSFAHFRKNEDKAEGGDAKIILF